MQGLSVWSKWSLNPEIFCSSSSPFSCPAPSLPLACLVLSLFAYPCCLVRITIQIALMPKTCDTSQEFAPGGRVPCCWTVPQISLCSSFPSSFIFFPFSGPRSPHSSHHFTLPLFILLTLSHRWPLVVSRTLPLSFVALFLSTFSPPPLSLYLQWLMSFLFFLSLSFRSAQVPHLSQDGTHIMAHKMFNPPVL